MAISKVSFFKTPQAADDYYYWTEDTLQQDTKVYSATTGYLTLDVMANDLGGNAKTLYSIDDGNGNPINPVDLFNVDTLNGSGVSAWELTADGNRARINNGKVEFDLSSELPGGVNSLGAGDQFTDTFIYAIRLGNGTLSWAHVHITIDGANDKATIIASDHEDTSVIEAGGVANGTAGDPDAAGQLTVTDKDTDESKFQTPASLDGTYGTFKFDADTGAWSYSLDQGKADKLFGGEAASDTLKVTSLDGSASYEIKVDITGSNDAPVAKDDTDSATEDAPVVNGSVATNDSDADAGAKLTYTLDAPVAGLTLNDDGTYSFDPSDDAYQHLPAGKSVDVVANYTVTDDKGATDAGTLTITITGVNDAPTITSNDGGDEASISIAENSSAVTTVVADDPDDGASVEYKISGGADSGLFAIDKDTGALSFIAAPNFESPDDDGKDNVYDVVVQAWDGADGDTQLLHVTVTDENEAPTDIQLSASKIDENNSAGAVVATLTATDPDGALSGFAGPFTYKLVSGTGDTDNGAFSIVGDQLTINGSANFEGQSSYSIRVQVKDAGGLTFEEVQTITVNDVNETPTDIQLSASKIDENNAPGAVVATLTATDPDGALSGFAGPFTYKLVSGAGDTDNGAFSIVGDQLTINGSASFEGQSSYSIRVQVKDAGGLTFEEVQTITVNDVNEAPTDIQLNASSINENNAAGAVVATLTATDPDGALSGFAGPFTYKLVSGTGDTDNAAFSIVGDQLQINGSANFEAQSSYSIRVQVKDAGGLTFEEVQTITINDVNEAPTLTVDATPVSVAENAPVLTVIGDVDGTDPDAGGGNDPANTFEDLKYSIVSVDGLTSGAIYSLFAIDGVTGTVTLAGALDYETDASYSLVIKVADGPGLFDQQTLVVNVTDVAEADPNDNDNDGLATKTTAGNGDNAANTLFGTTGGDDINGGGANDTIYGGAGNDTLNGNNDNDSIFGGSGNDVIDGGGGLDTIYGGSGNDQVTGQTDADTIFGGSGNDTINGGGGTAADVLIGGYGADSLTGAGGSDTFKYLSTLDAGDVITDFDGAGGTGNQDYIDLDGLFDALGVLAAARAGRVDVSTGGSDGGGTFSNLRIDADGNGSFELTLAKVYTTDALTAGHEATPNNFDIQVGI